jgi:cytochrome c-type biogenesis protein CcmF
MGLGFAIAVVQRGRKPRPAPAARTPRSSRQTQVA